MGENRTSGQPPGSTPERLVIEMQTAEQSDLPVYLTGNFNDWKAPDESYRMEKVEENRYRFTFADTRFLPAVLEYKYVRGDWSGEEINDHGQPVNNRRLSSRARKAVDRVPRWKRAHIDYDPGLLPEIRIISEHFEIPQLIRTRRITALLPHDYEQSDRRYPVLYLQDGQNLFDEYAPYGNWALDKKLAQLAEKDMADVIIIAIDHARENRIVEFTPSAKTKLGAGEGKKYVRFLADTLKPFVDKHFRTIPDRTHTGIGGSSMGGLISIYAGLMYPEVFGKLLIFSPSLWVAPNIHFHAIHLEESYDMKIYIYGGEGESANMVPNIRKFKQALEESGSAANIQFKLSVDPQGEHNEERWGEEFPQALEWLFFDAS